MAAVCDLCGKEIGPRSDQISLYAGKLTKRSVSNAQLAGTKTLSTYQDIKPVTLVICHRHRRDLWVQRLIAGSIAFILLYFPIVWIISNFLPTGTQQAYILLAALAAALDLIASALLARFVRYDGLIASLMTVDAKNKGSDIEYFNEQKYKRFTAAPPVS